MSDWTLSGGVAGVGVDPGGREHDRAAARSERPSGLVLPRRTAMSRPSSSRALVTSRHSSAPDIPPRGPARRLRRAAAGTGRWRWMPSEDIAVRLADALDAEDGGRRLLEIARRRGRTAAAVRPRAWRLRAARLKAADLLVEPDGAGVQ